MKSVNHGQSCGAIPENIKCSYYQFSRGVLLPNVKYIGGGEHNIWDFTTKLVIKTEIYLIKRCVIDIHWYKQE